MGFILNRKSEFIINDTILYPLGAGGGYDENLKYKHRTGL
jgi:hypothetical protein